MIKDAIEMTTRRLSDVGIIHIAASIANSAANAGNEAGANIHEAGIARMAPAPEPARFAKYTFPIRPIELTKMMPRVSAPKKKGSRNKT